MNKKINITANISIDTDYRYKYNDMLFAPKFEIHIF